MRCAVNPTSRSCLRIALAFTLLLFTDTAAARTPGEVAVRIELEAPNDCPSADAFLQAVLRRAPTARAANAAEPARSFRAVIERRGKRFAGRVDASSLSSTEAKVAEARSCNDLVDALAVTVALSLEVEAEQGTSRAAPAEPAQPDAPESGQSAPAVTAKPSSTGSEPSASWEWGGAASGVAVVSSLPALLGGEFALLARSAARGPWSPGIRLGAGIAANGGDTGLRLRWTYGSLSVCPTRVGREMLSLSACVRSLAGALRGEARERGTGSASLLLGATGAELHGDVRVGAVLIQARGAALATWAKPSFSSQPSGRKLVRVQSSLFEAGVGLGIVF